MVQDRADIDENHKWNVEEMYSSPLIWEEEFSRIKGPDKPPKWPELLHYKGKLEESSHFLADTLSVYFDIDRVLEKLYTYAHLRFDENLGDDEHKKMYARIHGLLHDFQMEASWIEPEILKIPNNQFEAFLQTKELEDYKNYLEKITRLKPHTLTENEEKLLALSGKAIGTSHKAFSALNNVDLKFKKAVDQNKVEHEVSQALYILHLRSKDRELRRSAYENLHTSFLEYQNTLAELINGQVQSHIYTAKARNYPSSLEAALFPHNIDTSVYDNLIDVVNKNLGVLHKYISLRKKLLGLDSIHVYDLYVPIIDDIDLNISYEEGKKIVLDAFEPLGEEYQNALEKGLFDERWVDVYENEHKRSGAYSSGCYDSYPYILLNYHGTLSDLFTLAHEAGHSMHSYFSRKNQIYQDAQYPIFVAEVASTFNEQLLLTYLLKHSKDKKEKAYLLNYALDNIRATLFRQTLFAEFEKKLHEYAEQGIPLTPQFLRQEYLDLNRKYYGEELVLDEYLEIEWARIPHFYYNFYVYQYATGISAAFALFEGMDSEKKKEDYLTFLSSGGSKYPVDLLRIAGVDMVKPDAIERTIEHFSWLIDELESLLSDGEKPIKNKKYLQENTK